MKPYLQSVKLPTLCIGLILSFVTASQSQQVRQESEWQIYSPDNAGFLMRVPGKPSKAQGHIFDPATEATIHNLLIGGVSARIFNFEIHKESRRMFLLSILYVNTKKSNSLRPFSQREVSLINNTIGDNVTHSTISTVSIKNGEVIQWAYKFQGWKNGTEVDGGRVIIKRTDGATIIVVVGYDYAEPDDPDISVMLSSLSFRK